MAITEKQQAPAIVTVATKDPKTMQQSNMIARVALLILFSLLLIVIMLPFYAILISSFKPGSEIIRYGLNLEFNLSKMTLGNYRELFFGDNSYFMWFKNSVLITIIQVAATLFVSAWVSYGLAMYRFRCKGVVFLCVLLIMMIPFEILMLPLYVQTINMKLINSMWGIILPFMASATTIFFFRQYLTGIPSEIVDAGRVDGATEYGIFIRLILPIMKPAFAAMAILNGMNSWNNFLWPMLVLRDSKKFTLSIGLNTLLTPYGNNYDLLIAGSCFSIVPIFILFICFQKYFIDGLTAGSVKG